MSEEARAEAERYARSDLGMAADEPNAATGIQERIVFADTVLHFTRGAEWQASRMPEAAPSDTDREALRKALRDVLTGASVQGDSERGADAVLAAGFSRSQPVQVEVTDYMVEKAAKAIYCTVRGIAVRDFEWPKWVAAENYRAEARAALSAALGGGE